jgi:hypothetical protein
MTVPLGYGGPLSNPYRQVVALDPNQQHFELGTGQLYMSAADFYLFIRSALNGTLITVANASRLFSCVPMVVVFIIRLMALKLPMVPA